MHFSSCLLFVFASYSLCLPLLSAEICKSGPEGMVLIPGGNFEMGGDSGLMGGGSQSHGSSYPIHEVRVDSFWMDVTEVTNREFNAFVEATGYVTFAERPLPESYLEEVRRVVEARIRELESFRAQSTTEEREAIKAAICQMKRTKIKCCRWAPPSVLPSTKISQKVKGSRRICSDHHGASQYARIIH